MNNKALSAAIALLLGVSGIISGCSEKLAVSKEDSEVSAAKNSEAEEKTETPELSRKDKIYQEYLSSQKLCNVSKEFKILEAGTAKDNPNGLAAAVKYDFDKDGKDELVTFTFERNSTNGEDIRLDLLKLKGKSLEVADSRFITEMADLSNQPKQDSIYFADAATTTGFLIHYVRLVAGTAAVFKAECFVFIGPVARTDRRPAERFVSGYQIQLNEEADDAGSGSFGIEAGFAFIGVGAAEASI